MKNNKRTFGIHENSVEAQERRAKDIRRLTDEQLQRQQETIRRHTRFEVKRGTRRALSRRAIRDSMQ